MRHQDIYRPKCIIGKEVTEQQRIKYYYKVSEMIKDKWKKKNALEEVFCKNNPLGQWKNAVEELYSITL